MKKLTIVSILLVVSIVFIPSIYSENNSDEIDQRQTNYDAANCLLGSVLFVQSFEPEFRNLTKVQLLMDKKGNLFGDSVLSIRESLTSNDLTSVSKESVEINNDMDWIEFDFPDITVIPGDTYYIIVQPDPESDGGEGFNFISWGFGWDDYYPNGSPFWKYVGIWNEGIPGHSSADYTFKTYGVNEINEEMVEIEVIPGWHLPAPVYRIRNIGETTIHNVVLTDTFVDGSILYNNRDNDIADEISPDEWVFFDSNSWFIGFGSFSVSVTITCDEGTFLSDETNGFIIGSLVFIP